MTGSSSSSSSTSPAPPSVNWSQLPLGALPLIATKLIKDYRDYLRLQAVCKPWRNFFNENPMAYRQPFPWLMLPYCRRSNNHGVVRPEYCKGEYCRCFHDVVTNEFYHIDFPEAFGKICQGAGFGWLAFTQLESPSGFLLNPMTRRRIDLPPITTLPDVKAYRPNKVGREYVRDGGPPNSDRPPSYQTECARWMTSQYTQKILITDDPTRPDCVVVGMFWLTRLAIWKPSSANGSDQWTAVSKPDKSCPSGSFELVRYEDFVLWRNRLYAVDDRGDVDVLSPDSSTMLCFIRTRRYPKILFGGRHYLVVNPSTGELMMVYRKDDIKPLFGPMTRLECEESDDDVVAEEEDDDDDDEEDGVYSCRPVDDGDRPNRFQRFLREHFIETSGFEVYRLDPGTNDDWERVESIGDYALFVGNSGAVFVSGDDYSGCRVNCIYFTYDVPRWLQAENYHGGQDIGVYDIREGRVEPFSCKSLYDPVLISPPPVWIFPCIDP